MLKLRLLRLAKDLTLTEAAKQCGVQASDLCRLEKGQMKPYPSHVQRLESFYGCEISELLQEVDTKKLWKVV